MVDDDLFDGDGSGNFDPFADMGDDDYSLDEDEPSGKKGTRKRTLDEFNAEVDRRIAVLMSPKQSQKTRAAAALWLGESGDTRAIKPLVQIYLRGKRFPRVRNAAKQALGRFRALDIAIERGDDEMVEDALGRVENTWVIEMLQDVAYNERKPRSRARPLLLMNGVLGILLALLFVIYDAAPTGVVDLRELELGGGGQTEPTRAPETPVNTLDPNETPAPTDPPTLTPTPSDTPTPEISDSEIRRFMGQLYTLLDAAATERGFVDQLQINWTSIANDPAAASRLCPATPPTIPQDVELPPRYVERQPILQTVTDMINTGLATIRTGWAFWHEHCAAGDLPNFINDGFATLLLTRDAFNTARSFLDIIPQ